MSLDLGLPERIEDTPVWLKLRLPQGMEIRGVKVNGSPHPLQSGDWVVLTGLSGAVRIDVTAGSE